MAEPKILEDADVGPEILAKSIVNVAESAKKLLESRITDETLYLLIQHGIKPASHRPTIDQIKQVLHSASKLDKLFLKPTLPPLKGK